MVEVPLSNGGVALIDAEDVRRVGSFRWSWIAGNSEQGIRYAVTSSGKRILSMHRLLLNARRGQIIDHRDRDGLNNQKDNLRFCTRSQNAANTALPAHNTSGGKGVSWDTQHGSWLVMMRAHGQDKYLGRFSNLEEAIRTYNTAHCKAFGEFARPTPLPPSGAFDWLRSEIGLTERQQAIVNLHLDQCLPRHEVAERLGLTQPQFEREWAIIRWRVMNYQESIQDADPDEEAPEVLMRKVPARPR